MISERWAKQLELLNKQVDIKLNVLHRRLSGQELTDWMLWDSELADTDISMWETLW